MWRNSHVEFGYPENHWTVQDYQPGQSMSYQQCTPKREFSYLIRSTIYASTSFKFVAIFIRLAEYVLAQEQSYASIDIT